MSCRLNMRTLRFAVAGIALLVVGVLVVRSLQSGGTSEAIDADGNRVTTGAVAAEGASPDTGAPAPGFVLADYDGRAVRLSDFRGKIVFLNFWATWCTTCDKEMPDMQTLAAEMPDDLVVLAVNQAESVAQARPWSEARGLTALRYAMDDDESVSRAYKLPSGLPHSFFIDPSGVIRAVRHGGLSLEDMRALIAETRAAATP